MIEEFVTVPSRTMWMSLRSLMICAIVIIAGAGCDAWQPPVPTAQELDGGLVVMYPGSFNTTIEMIGFYNGLREGGVSQAIVVHHWGGFMEHMLFPIGTTERNLATAQREAEFLTNYKHEHPNGFITLLSYSGGATVCALIPQAMPPDVSVDRVVMLSPAIAADTDLSPMLARLTDKAVVYWSPKDEFTPAVGGALSLGDGTYGPPAATYGFSMVNSKLFQVEWRAEWEAYGVAGSHTDYVLMDHWIGDIVAPWVLGTSP